VLVLLVASTGHLNAGIGRHPIIGARGKNLETVVETVVRARPCSRLSRDHRYDFV